MYHKILILGALTLLSGTIFCDKNQNSEPSDGHAIASSSSTTTIISNTSIFDEKASSNVGSPTSEDLKNFEAFKNSDLYVAPFEDSVLSLPAAQLEFVRSTTKGDLEIMQTILKEAIIRRNNLISPSVTLMWKYSGKLLGTLISNRLAERKLHPRVDPKPSFFIMLARIIEKVIDRSTELKKENHYDKKSVSIEELSERADDMFNYINKIIDISPIGGYLKWNTTILIKGDICKTRHNPELLEEIADLVAQFRALGYDGWTFVGRRTVNLLNLFARGMIPSFSDVNNQNISKTTF